MGQVVPRRHPRVAEQQERSPHCRAESRRPSDELGSVELSKSGQSGRGQSPFLPKRVRCFDDLKGEFHVQINAGTYLGPFDDFPT
jgi:hypothetical protein